MEEEEWLSFNEAAILFEVDRDELSLWMHELVLIRNRYSEACKTDEELRAARVRHVIRRQDSSTEWEVKHRRVDFEDAITLHNSKRLTGA